MPETRIHRTTLFKVPDPENQQKLLKAYQVLVDTNSKDGKPYILFLCAGATTAGDPRAKGYTVVCKSEFASMEDMRYYDEECAAHKALKATAQGLGVTEPPLTVYFEGAPILMG